MEMDYIQKLFVIIFVCTPFYTVVNAGTCWWNVDTKLDADPETFKATNVTRLECCKLEPAGEEKYYSDDEPSPGEELWRWKFLKSHKCTMACQDGCSTFAKRCDESELCRVKPNGIPKCICNPYCSKNHLSKRGKVCGSDGKTYSHHCQLLRQNCRRKMSVEVNYFGACKAFSCKDISCAGNGTRCVTDQYNRPKCVLELRACGRSPPSPICATNNQTFQSRCHMDRYNMNKGKSVKLSYNAECSEKLSCETDEKCKRCIHDKRSGSYICELTEEPHCSEEDKSPEVCGTDEVTYRNECTLRLHSYVKKEHLTVQHVGNCNASTRDMLMAGRILDSPNDNHIDESSFLKSMIFRHKWKANRKLAKHRKLRRYL